MEKISNDLCPENRFTQPVTRHTIDKCVAVSGCVSGGRGGSGQVKWMNAVVVKWMVCISDVPEPGFSALN